jgi:carboxylate-amine ligase
MAKALQHIVQSTKPLTGQYSFGIEEEYFVTRRSRRGVCDRAAVAWFEACDAARPCVYEHEMLQCQIEAATPPLVDMEEGTRLLRAYRATLNEVGQAHDIAIVAAGAHPKAFANRQHGVDKPRYRAVMRDLQMLGRRNMVCGMHVHVEIPDPDRRPELMARLTPFLPILLALSTSSPFWEGRRTGLMGYRLASYDELPRTGLPPAFASTEDYEGYLETMTAAKAIKDASYLWWAVRPSKRYPTLELRIADSCTFVEDAIAIAALYRALSRKLMRDDSLFPEPSGATQAIALENKWRAQRYGVRGAFIDEARRQAIPFAQTLEDLIELIGEDAEALGCLDEALAARGIAKRGASADRQIAVFEAARRGGASPMQALDAVVDWLIEASVARRPGAARKIPTNVGTEARATV